MSTPLKILVVVAAILLGILLYLRTSPARHMQTATSQQTVPSSLEQAEDGDLPALDRQAEPELMKAIAPCWSRMADASALAVTLRVSFDADGGIASPPEIERKPGAPISLTSESQALQALAACAPYRMVREQRNVVVAFPSPTRPATAMSDRR